MDQKSRVRKRIEKLAMSRANDAVRLVFLELERLGDLEKLDLSAVTEIKRSSNGSVEVKFIDRFEALKWLAETEAGTQAERFFEALEKSAEET